MEVFASLYGLFWIHNQRPLWEWNVLRDHPASTEYAGRRLARARESVLERGHEPPLISIDLTAKHDVDDNHATSRRVEGQAECSGSGGPATVAEPQRPFVGNLQYPP